MTEPRPSAPPPPGAAPAPQFHTAGVLLVEDNLADVRLTVELLREAKLANRLTVIGDGTAALAYLAGAGQGPGAEPLPDVILLDLDLPGADGRTVLGRLRATPRLQHIPVYLLTASATHSEMVQEEELDADGYLEKPMDLRAFVPLVTHHERFWLELVCAAGPPHR